MDDFIFLDQFYPFENNKVRFFLEFQRVIFKTMMTLAFCMILELQTVVLINSGSFFYYLTEFEFQEMESESF